MRPFKPRKKKAFLQIFRDLKVSDEVREVLAEMGAEMDMIAYEAIQSVRTDVLATLQLVEMEFAEHDAEYHHITSPEVKAAVRRAIQSVGGKPRKAEK